ncbi:serine/threonine protein kinase [Dissulfurirhabdus thermomarina]|uniref:serine/threonine protein kinase n=2 Tax=Dissulfurirhabdus thermomarina TaxID=1765737 RepID=UPI0015E8C222|nr:serine/threonine protein kinase [Dissulfurirhabdus thermomarina]
MGRPEDLPPAIARRLAEYLEARHVRRRPRVFHDTHRCMAIDYGDVIVLEGRYYVVTGHEREGRFGIDEQPKFWVKRAVDLETGDHRILKLVFHETFQITLGRFRVTCYRSPEKEARVLELVRGDLRFMQGEPVEDAAGNLVRVLEIIRGQRLDNHIAHLGGSHRHYFHREVPRLLRLFLEALAAIDTLHAHGFKHGDIRRDHVLIDAATGRFRWIDFDYDFYLPERPFALDLFGLGNILLFIVGRGNYRPLDVYENPALGPKVIDRLTTDDLSLLFRDRIVNLKKLFPYIPEELNRILLHFSAGARVFYDSADEIAEDLERVLAGFPEPPPGKKGKGTARRGAAGPPRAT